eukprot:132394-Hanusia_phi.AAC.2
MNIPVTRKVINTCTPEKKKAALARTPVVSSVAYRTCQTQTCQLRLRLRHVNFISTSHVNFISTSHVSSPFLPIEYSPAKGTGTRRKHSHTATSTCSYPESAPSAPRSPSSPESLRCTAANPSCSPPLSTSCPETAPPASNVCSPPAIEPRSCCQSSPATPEVRRPACRSSSLAGEGACGHERRCEEERRSETWPPGGQEQETALA